MFDEMTRQFNGVDSDNDGQIDAKESEEKDKDGDGVPDARDPCDDDPDCPTPRPPPAACRQDEGEPCVVGVGACREIGELACNDDLSGTECVGQPGLPTDEVCDGKDNDCDGETDEDFTDSLGTPCTDGQGVCQRSGIFECRDKQLQCVF